MVALATLTAAADQACATSLLAALPNQAEVTRIGAEALAAWAHRLYAGPGYWNPLRPDLLAEQHLADTAQLPALAIAAARLAAGQRWEASVLTQLLAELTRGAPNQPAVRAALDELLAAALPRIVDLAITTGPAELADLASLALQLAPQPDLAAPLADQMPEHSVRLAALAATLTSQQVTQYRADALGGEPDAANRLAGSLNNLSVRLGDLGRREEALAASQEAAELYRELAAARPDAFRPDLAMSLNNLSVRLAEPGAAGGRAGREPGGRHHPPGAGRGPPGRVPPRPGRVAEQPVLRLAGLGRREDALAAIQEAAGDPPGAGRGPPGRVPARPGRVAEQPVRLAGRPGAAGGGAGRDPGSRHPPPGAGRGPPGRVPPRPGRVAEQPVGPAWPAWGGGRRRWPRSRRPPPSTGSWPRPARTRSGPTWPCR